MSNAGWRVTSDFLRHLIPVRAVRCASFVLLCLPAAAAAQPVGSGVDLRAWSAEAMRLERAMARPGADVEAVRERMTDHALRLDPALPDMCDTHLAELGGGVLAVYAPSARERVVTVACTNGPVLANASHVIYRLRLDGRLGSAMRLRVPHVDDRGALHDEPATSGMLDVRQRGTVLRVVNRCCAGAEGVTTTYRVPGGSAGSATHLGLVHAVRWRLDERGREAHRTVLWPRR